MPTKNAHRFCEIKGIDESGAGSFTGLLSPYGLVDQGGDMVVRGAYTKTIQANAGKVPLLWMHKEDQPIGMLQLDDREDGLWVKGELDLDVQKGREAYSLLKKHIVTGLSIGFKPSEKPEFKDGVRHLKSIDLFEGSVVTFPMALEARVSAVKAAGPHSKKELGYAGGFDDLLSRRAIGSFGYSCIGTLSDILCDIWWNAGIDPDSFYAEDTEALMTYAGSVFDEARTQFMGGLQSLTDMVSGAMDDGDDETMKSFLTGLRAEMSLERKAKASGKTKKVDGEDLGSSAFLIVGDDTDPSTWKLPVKFSTDAKSHAHLKNALARINQVQGVSSAALASAKTKLKKLAKDAGIAVVDKSLESTLETKSAATELLELKARITELEALTEDPAIAASGVSAKSQPTAPLEDDASTLVLYGSLSALSEVIRSLPLPGTTS